MPGLDVVSSPARVDPESAFVRAPDGAYEVVYAGATTMVLRPFDEVADDLVITTADLGLMPGGLHCAPPVFARWLDYAVGSDIPLRTAVQRTGPAEQVDLHLPHVRVDVDALRLAEDLHREAAPVGSHDAIDTAMCVAYYALARETLDLELAVFSLIGAGPGSTPTGDDVLVGVSAALSCTGHTEASTMVASAARSMVDRTTRASRLYLRAAVDGRYAERVHRLAKGMSDPSEAAIVMAAARGWGATSGLDLAAGLLGGLTIVAGQGGADGATDGPRPSE